MQEKTEGVISGLSHEEILARFNDPETTDLVAVGNLANKLAQHAKAAAVFVMVMESASEDPDPELDQEIMKTFADRLNEMSAYIDAVVNRIRK